MSIDHELQIAAHKALPIAAVATPAFLGASLPTWLIIASLVWTLLQIYVLVRDKLWAPWRARQASAEHSSGSN